MTYRKWTVGGDQVIDLLNNAIVIGPFPRSGLAVGAKTLIFSDPAVTVTFPGSNGDVITLPNIISAIQQQVTGAHVEPRSYIGSTPKAGEIQQYLAVFRDGGMTLGQSGTANQLFGFSTSGNTVIKAPIPQGNIKGVARSSVGEYEIFVGGSDTDWTSPSPDGSSTSPGGGGDGVVVP